MSNQTPTRDPWDGVLFSVAGQLAPLFETKDTDPDDARQSAMSALAAYHPESRADFVNIARILAFSMASLAALGMAVADDLTPALKMRYFGRANALNRSADQSERIMMQRRREQRANPPAERPAHLRPRPADPEPSPDDAAIDAAVEEAMAAYRASKVSPPAEEPAPRVQTSTQPAPRPFDIQPALPPIAIRAAIPGKRQRRRINKAFCSAPQCLRPPVPSNLDLRLDPSPDQSPSSGKLPVRRHSRGTYCGA